MRFKKRIAKEIKTEIFGKILEEKTNKHEKSGKPEYRFNIVIQHVLFDIFAFLFPICLKMGDLSVRL